MKYGVLTTRHHDGFALWPSAVGNFSVAQHPLAERPGRRREGVRRRVPRARPAPGLYYSVWDNTQGTGNGTVTRAQIDYVKTQLTELLTNYGAIDILVFDGWSWKMGHKAMPYQEIRELVKSIQPSCLLLDHTHFMSPWDADVAAIEEPKGAFVARRQHLPRDAGPEDQQRRQRLVLVAEPRHPDDAPTTSSTATSRCSSRAGPTSSSTARPTATA